MINIKDRDTLVHDSVTGKLGRQQIGSPTWKYFVNWLYRKLTSTTLGLPGIYYISTHILSFLFQKIFQISSIFLASFSLNLCFLSKEQKTRKEKYRKEVTRALSNKKGKVRTHFLQALKNNLLKIGVIFWGKVKEGHYWANHFIPYNFLSVHFS